MIVVAVLLFVLAAAFAAIGVLARVGALPGNSFVGVRTPETRRDPEIWRLANRVLAPPLLAAALVAAFAGVGVIVLDGLGWEIAAAILGVVGALVLVGIGGQLGAKAAAGLTDLRAARQGDACCSSGDDACAPGADSCATDADPSADCGVVGGCGSCELQGMCESEPGRRK